MAQRRVRIESDLSDRDQLRGSHQRSMAGRHVPCHCQSNAAASPARPAHHGTSLARRCASNGAASTSGRHHLPESQPARKHRCVQLKCSVVAPGREQDVAQTHQTPSDPQPVPARALLCDPEEFTVASGELSTVNQEASQRPEDVFRCSGCSLQECQVRPCWYTT